MDPSSPPVVSTPQPVPPPSPAPSPAPGLPPSGGSKLGPKLAIAGVAGLLVIVLAAYAAANRGNKPTAEVVAPSPSATPAPTTTPTATLTTTATPTPADKTPTPTATPKTTTTPKPSTPTPTPPPVVYTYHNGSYSAIGHYNSPGGYEGLNVTLTVTNDYVTAATVTSGATNSTAASYQSDFIAHYQSSVVGKKLSTLNLGKIATSSLTPIGFNDAATQIRSQAD